MFNTLVSLDKSIPSNLEKKGCDPFDLKFPGFSGDGKKILFIMGHVPTLDLHIGQLLGSKAHRGMLRNIIELSLKNSRNYAERTGVKKPSLKDFDLSFINYNFCKSYHIKSYDTLTQIDKLATDRIKKYVAKTKPDKIVIFGLREATAIFGRDEGKLLGLKHTLKVKGKKYPVYVTLDLARALPEGKEKDYSANDDKGRLGKANLIGYVAHTLTQIWLDKNPYSVKNVEPNAIYVDTIKKFKKMMKVLNSSETPIAVDTETKDLTVISNKILTFQFAVSEDKGYVLPYLAKYSPFDYNQKEYIKKKLAKFFKRKTFTEDQFLIFQGGKFDIPLIRHELKIPYLHWPVWDTIAGEVVLDENLVLLDKIFHLKPWALDYIASRYENDFYQRAKFSKGDRENMENTDLTDNVLKYMSMDVQLLIAIQKAQVQRSKDIKHRKGSYAKVYKRFVLNQMSAMVKVISEMIYRGNPLDMGHLFKLYSKDSPVKKVREKAIRELYQTKAAKKANKILLKDSGLPTSGLFKGGSNWVFDIGTEKHKRLLYLDVLQLAPIDYGKWKTNKETGEKYREASLDSSFQEKYSDVEEVAMLTRINKLRTLYATFCKGIYLKAAKDPDILKDACLRPKYGFEDVVTGRSNSYGPSLHQIPERSEESKYIKRMFITLEGFMFIKLDYSTHEIRGWGIVSGDNVLAELFRKVNKYILRYRAKPTAKRLEDVKNKADPHKINYSMFTGVKVEKVTKEQRTESKSLGFGTIYGMSLASLAKTLKKTKEYTQSVLDKFFGTYVRGSKWLKLIKEFARDNLYSYSLLGRRRNLTGYLINDKSISSALDRRAANSAIQGLCSDIAYFAGELAMKHIYAYYERENRLPESGLLPCGLTQQVHDALKFIAPCEDYLCLLRIIEYITTKGVVEEIEKIYGVKFVLDLGIEFELGATGDTLKKWDWSEKNLWEVIKAGLKTQKEELGYDINIKKTMKAMYRKLKQNEKWLLENYPLDIDKYRDTIVDPPFSEE